MAIKRIIFVSLAAVLLCGPSHAATITADSCENKAGQLDVQAAVNSASTGDTVVIPAGSATWDTTVTIPDDKKITIRGAGKTNTTITVGTIKAIQLNDSGSRITEIGFVGGQTSDGILYINGLGWRVDNCKFTNTYGYSIQTIIIDSVNSSLYTGGLIDNNEFIEGRIVCRAASNTAESYDLWATDYAFGSADTTGTGTIYIEDNSFHKTVSGGGNVVDAENYYMGYYTFRYNTITGCSSVMAHPLQVNEQRGQRGWESYGNKFVATTCVPGVGVHFMRSGSGFIFFNSISSNHTQGLAWFDIWRVYSAVSGTTTTGYCDGSTASGGGAYDGGFGTPYPDGYPCRDQMGWGGTDEWDWNDTPYPPNTRRPGYLFQNYTDGDGALNTSVTIANGAGDYIVEDRDYFQSTASFDGSAGIGAGTSLPADPSAYADWVGFWLTSDATSIAGDISDYIGYDHTKNITGTLYVVQEGEWVEYYTPYTYPHPLRGEGHSVTLSGPHNLTIDGGSYTMTME